MTDHELSTAPIVEMSDDISALAKALPKAQAAMGEVFKNATNPAFKSKYADLASVVDAVLPALNANGIALLQPAAGLRGDVVQVATMLLHESGQWLRCTMSVTLSKRDAHGIGSAVTYGRRFGLQSMSGVAPTDDDGNEAASQPSNDRASPPISQDQADALRLEIEAVGADPVKFLAFFKIKALEAMPAGRWNEAVAMLEAKRMKDAA